MSASFLSQVENDKARPRIETLHRIAAALDTTAQALLAAAAVVESAASGAPVVTRAARDVVIHQSDDPSDGVVRSLGTVVHDFHAMEIRGAPADFGASYEHPGGELLYVVDGHVEVEVGSDRFRLGPGDAVSYSGEVPHRTRRIDGDVRLVIVTSGDD